MRDSDYMRGVRMPCLYVVINGWVGHQMANSSVDDWICKPGM